MVSVSARYVCNFIASAPAALAASISLSARSRLPLWLAESSATTNGLVDGIGVLDQAEALRFEEALRPFIVRRDVGEEPTRMAELQFGQCAATVAARLMRLEDEQPDLALLGEIDRPDWCGRAFVRCRVIDDQIPSLIGPRRDEGAVLIERWQRLVADVLVRLALGEEIVEDAGGFGRGIDVDKFHCRFSKMCHVKLSSPVVRLQANPQPRWRRSRKLSSQNDPKSRFQ